jgi:histone deacetylase 1/2
MAYTDIPVNEYYEYFGPDYQLDVKPSNTNDLNTPQYLDRVKGIVLENLRHTGGPPSVQMTGTLHCQAVCLANYL